MKTNTKYFKAVAADMKLEQSIQHWKEVLEELEGKRNIRHMLLRGN